MKTQQIDATFAVRYILNKKYDFSDLFNQYVNVVYVKYNLDNNAKPSIKVIKDKEFKELSKLKDALTNLPKVAPKKGVYQGDLMYSGNDAQKNKDGSVSFTPNTITYTAHGDTAKKIAKSKLGVVVHTQYNDKGKAEPLSRDNEKSFGQHPDVHWHSANYDASKATYEQAAQNNFIKSMSAAKKIHDTHGDEMYNAIEPHGGEAGHLSTYINQTVRDGSKPTAKGLQQHIANKYQKAIEKLKTEIQEFMRDYDVLIDNNGNVIATWKNTAPKSLFDLKRFKDEAKDLYLKYTNVAKQSRVFLIK